jgi:hypothetical protein
LHCGDTAASHEGRVEAILFFPGAIKQSNNLPQILALCS